MDNLNDQRSPTEETDAANLQSPLSAATARQLVANWLLPKVAAHLTEDAGPPSGKRTLAELGFDSLKAIALQYELQTAFNVTLPLQVLLGRQSLDDLAVLAAEDPEFLPRGHDQEASASSEVVL